MLPSLGFDVKGWLTDEGCFKGQWGWKEKSQLLVMGRERMQAAETLLELMFPEAEEKIQSF